MPSMRLELASLLGGILRNAREHKFIISTLEDIQQLRSTFASLSADYQTRKRTRQEYALSVFFQRHLIIYSARASRSEDVLLQLDIFSKFPQSSY